MAIVNYHHDDCDFDFDNDNNDNDDADDYYQRS